MIMRKYEKIIEAWGVHYAPDIDENGFRKYSEFDKHLLYQWSDDWFLKSYNEITKEWCVIPKNLKGIEDNNGWIKIESESDLPKNDDGAYWIANENGRFDFIATGCQIKAKWKNETCTHYKEIGFPKDPIY